MKCSPEIKNRIKRTQGQINGVLNMMENDSDCEAIVIQLKAIKSSIEKAISLITTTNLIQTIEETNEIKLNGIEDAIKLIVKGV